MGVNAPGEAAPAIAPQDTPFDFESAFRAHYGAIARVIARIVGDPARAEELAVEVFWKLWRSPRLHGERAPGWLYKAAVRKGLDELRRRSRRTRYESLTGFTRPNPTPEEVRAVSQEQENVRRVLAAMSTRHAELLVLRSQGLSYDELASALSLNAVSVGTLLRRAQQAFRKEYVRRYEKK
jgi:RNA polymerase sigma-70 factor (ECF subfamily)